MRTSTIVNISLDKLICSIPEHHDVFYDINAVPDYVFHKYFKDDEDADVLDYEDKELLQKYKSIAIFYHKTTGNRLRISNMRKRKHGYVSPLYLIFDSSYSHPLSCDEAFPVRDHFQQKYNVHLRPTGVHLATDLIGPKNSGLHDVVVRSIKAGKKGAPDHIINGTLYFGALKSASRVAVYDKTKELWEKKGIPSEVDISRIELRLKITRLGNFVRTLEDLATHDWSFVYPKYFSLHEPNYLLKSKLRRKKKHLLLPIWMLRDLMRKDYGIPPSNFFRDLLKEHSIFAYLVREALDDYRWCPKPH